MARTRSPRLASVLCGALAGLAILLAACGGSSGGGKAADNGITRPEYVKKIDAICRRSARESKPTFDGLQALVDASGTYKSRLIKATPLLKTTYKLQSAKLKRFKAVQPPTADRAQVAAITQAADATLAELKKFLPAAAVGDLSKFIDIATDASGERAKVDRLGTDYGFESDCFSLPIKLS
jgi:hypothetical protein